MLGYKRPIATLSSFSSIFWIERWLYSGFDASIYFYCYSSGSLIDASGKLFSILIDFTDFGGSWFKTYIWGVTYAGIEGYFTAIRI